jgi:hypothetical protein
MRSNTDPEAPKCSSSSRFSLSYPWPSASHRRSPIAGRPIPVRALSASRLAQPPHRSSLTPFLLRVASSPCCIQRVHRYRACARRYGVGGSSAPSIVPPDPVQTSVRAYGDGSGFGSTTVRTIVRSSRWSERPLVAEILSTSSRSVIPPGFPRSFSTISAASNPSSPRQ